MWSVACAREENVSLRPFVVGAVVFPTMLSSIVVVAESTSERLSLFCLLQVGIMLAQRRYGRNFMVPQRFQPPKFDYHRPIPPELSDEVPTAYIVLCCLRVDGIIAGRGVIVHT